MTILIQNGAIIDGTGKKKYRSDLLIENDKIKKIGDLKKFKADKIINARGFYVAPGFIDIHNHSDSYWNIFISPNLESMVLQGVTTIVGGNCGSSLAPLARGNIINSIQKWADIKKVNINWLKMDEFLSQLEKRKIGANFITLTGHATLRRGLIGDEFRPVKKEELERMKLMLRESMEAGAWGLSTGLAYSHAKIASAEEIIEITKILKKYNGIYSTHIRGEAKELLPAINETIKIGRETGVSVEISHLKAMGQKFWPAMEKAIKMIEIASKSININFDIYPYTVTGSVLYVLLPDWVAEGGKQMLIKRLKDPSIKAKIIEEMKEEGYDHKKVTIAALSADKIFIGRKITDIAKNQQVSAEEAIINILLASEGRALSFVDTLSEDNVEMGLKHKLSFIGSDGSGYNLKYSKTGELVHPRCFGAFPRVLGRYVREKEIISYEEAVRKMTGGPAEKLGIKNRGLIKEKYFADICVFNPRTIADKATFTNPYQYPEGIEYVMINGKIAVEERKYTGEMGGKVLRKK